MFSHIGGKHLKPALLVISDGKTLSASTIANRIRVHQMPVGWVGMMQLKRKIGISDSVHRTSRANSACTGVAAGEAGSYNSSGSVPG